jgi:HEAT repeat protein
VLFAFAAVLVVERTVIFFNLPALYPILWITINIISAVLGTFMWNMAAEVCDTRQAKRLFSLFVSAGILGGVMGNLVTGELARLFKTENLLVLYIALLLLSLMLTRRIARQFFRPVARVEAGVSLLTEMRAGYDFVRGSLLMQLIVFASILFSVLFFSVSFPFSKVVSASFRSETEVASFLGLFSGVTTAVTFVVSLLIANRLYTRIGVVNAVLVLPLTYLLGFIVFAANFTLTTAVVVRFAQMVVMAGVADSAWSALFNVAPPERRAQVRSFESGVPSQIGIMLSGVLLILGEHVLTTKQIFVMGMIVALGCTVLVWRMRRGYADALIASLRSGLLDVFTATPRGLQNLGTDASARQVVMASLTDPKWTVRRISVELAARLGLREAIEPLSRMLNDPEAQVRQATLAALAQLEAREAVEPITARLDDPEPDVRAAAIDALAALSPQSSSHIANALQDSHPMVRARAAIALHRSGDTARALATIAMLLDSHEPAHRVAGLRAFAEPAFTDLSRIVLFLHDDSVTVRLVAIETLSSLKSCDAHQALLQALDDADERVRQGAALVLRACDDVWQAVTGVLTTGSERAQEVALIALEGHGALARPAIVDWALQQIPRAAQLRGWAATFARLTDGKDSRALIFLRDLIYQREWQIEQRILHALTLLGTVETLHLISKGLRSRDQETRAQALETIDTLGDKRIARGLISLLEDDALQTTQDARALLGKLTAHPDPWLRALAVRATGDLLARDWRLLYTCARNDSELIVREAAVSVLAGMGGEMPDTYQTLGTMDRILALRQVPLFGNLAPEDLQRIAEIASERIVQAGDYVCREDEIGDELFVIVEGQVRVTKHSNGTERTLRILQAGEHVGELAILREQPRSASVSAEGGSIRVLVIRGDALKAILHERPEVALAMLASLAERLSTQV